MSRKDLSKDVLNVVNSKTGKKVSPRQISKLASGVNASTVKSEAQLRQLIKQVGSTVNVKVPESTVREIVKAVKQSGFNPNNMEQMIKTIMSKR
ncbi:hypothetical protein DUZ99_10730 [Xylanibacillus composti]|uniref:Stage VI sporulation protein F n=1 Tax=Xylanibacillus composti TaxID=1572762 RepID=A0A8J4H573_9BACL|nr:stage VI sporulation protein F [Xylanibacillus composti]MDT9725445.1 hypothetical protein [Xylanibacillus composti]GIQ71039.1 hypothetical protein XYCOK13_38630 [Xylanibacillus composti]